MQRIALSSVALLIAALPLRGAEPQHPSDETKSLKALSEISILLKRNEQGNVRTAICAGCKRRRPTQDELVHLKGLPELESIVLQSIREFNDTGLTHLTGLKRLTSLRLPRTHKVSAAGIEHLGTMTQLDRLDLGDSHFTTDDLQKLIRMLPQTTIKHRGQIVSKVD